MKLERIELDPRVAVRRRGKPDSNGIAPGGPERPIFGKVRYMSHASTSQKFASTSYMASIDDMPARGRMLSRSSK